MGSWVHKVGTFKKARMQGTAPDAVPSLDDEASRSSSAHAEVARVLFKTPTKSESDDQKVSDDEEDYTIDYSAFDHTTLGYTSGEGETTFNGDGDDTWDGQTGARGSDYYYLNGDELSTYASASAFTFRTEESHGNMETESSRRSHEEETNATNSDYDDSTAVSRSMWRPDDIKAYFQRLSRTHKETEDGNVTQSCHEALVTAPRDVLKHLFDYRGTPTEPHQTPTSIATTQATEVTSNTTKETLNWTRQIESLQRECKTLKEIIDGDSKHILLLKAEIQNFREKGGSKDSGIEFLEKEIKDLRERERSLLETVDTLQENLSRGNQLEKEASVVQSKEIQRLQLQCQMFSFQIVELEKENQVLTTENENLRSDMSLMTVSNSRNQAHEITPTKEIQHRPMESLRAQVSSLVDKFTQIEEDMDRRDKARDEQSRTLQALESLEDSSTIPFVYSSSDISTPDKVGGTPIPVTAEKDQYSLPAGCSQEEDVEVTLDGLIIATSRSEDPQQVGKGPGLSSTGSAEESAFCGCLNSSSD